MGFCYLFVCLFLIRNYRGRCSSRGCGRGKHHSPDRWDCVGATILNRPFVQVLPTKPCGKLHLEMGISQLDFTGRPRKEQAVVRSWVRNKRSREQWGGRRDVKKPTTKVKVPSPLCEGLHGVSLRSSWMGKMKINGEGEGGKRSHFFET